MKLILLILLFTFTPSQDSFKVLITGFDNDKGKVMLRARDEQGNLLLEKMANIKGKKAEIIVPLGTAKKVAIEAFHDENDNDKLDKNFLGVPTEKWGVSSDNRPMLKAPELKDILVRVKANSIITVKLD